MRRVFSICLFVFPFCLAAFAAPAARIAANKGVDPNGLYFVLGNQGPATGAQFEAMGAKLIGPEPRVFGQFLSADTDVLSALKTAGFVVMSGSAFAQICGVSLRFDSNE